MGKPRILVVDDYPGARYRRMRILMDDGGFDVAEEMLGREAVRRVADEAIDAVLVDLHLPDISGLDVCTALRGNPRTAGVPVLMISAVSDHEDAARLSEAAGADAFLPDTDGPEALVAAVRSMLAKVRPFRTAFPRPGRLARVSPGRRRQPRRAHPA
jgi:CheY-like chemotaxis protein